jgi:hypothetical protein
MFEPLEGRHRPGSHRRSVHAAGVELNDTIRVGQASVSNGDVIGIGLDKTDTLDRSFDRWNSSFHTADRTLDSVDAVG